MADDRWIEVPNWDLFQHPDAARSGVLPWIKVYTRLMSHPDFLDLTFAERGLLLSIWLEYATSRAALREHAGSMTRQLGQKVDQRALNRLNHAGFVQFSASKPASRVASTEKRREELTPKSPYTQASNKPSQSQPRCSFCGLTFKSQNKLAEHLYHQHDGPEPDHWLEAEHLAAKTPE